MSTDPLSGPTRPDKLAASPPLEAITPREWSDLARRLTRYAHVRSHKASWETAEEIAQEAIVRLLDPAYASWDRERHPDVFDCLGHIVNGLVANRGRLKSVRARHVPLRDDLEPHDDELAAPAETSLARGRRDVRGEGEEPEALVHDPMADAALLTDDRTAESGLEEERRAEVALTALRARLEGDALALGVLERRQNGEERPFRLAKMLGVDVNEIYLANRRIAHHARSVGRELEKGES